jgi:hypothetical protein
MGDFIAPWNLLQLTLIAIYPMYLSFFRIANGKYIYDWLVIYRITAVLKVETDIIASIAASPTGDVTLTDNFQYESQFLHEKNRCSTNIISTNAIST